MRKYLASTHESNTFALTIYNQIKWVNSIIGKKVNQIIMIFISIEIITISCEFRELSIKNILVVFFLFLFWPIGKFADAK